MDRYAAAREALVSHVRSAPGATSSALRAAAASGEGLPEDLRSLVAKIRAHAYEVTHEDIDALRPRYDEDAVFEIVVAAALGAAEERLLAGLRALEAAR